MIDICDFTLIYLGTGQSFLFQKRIESIPLSLELASYAFVSWINLIAGNLLPVVNEPVFLNLKNLISILVEEPSSKWNLSGVKKGEAKILDYSAGLE